MIVHRFSEPERPRHVPSIRNVQRLLLILRRAAALSFIAGVCVRCGGDRAPDATEPQTRGEGSAFEAVAAAKAPATGNLEGRPSAVATALRARRFADLEVLFKRLTNAEADQPESGEVPVFLAFQALNSADPDLEPVLIEWRASDRRSPFPDLALAEHYLARAWAARGGRWASETPRVALEEFRRWRAAALPLAHSAVNKSPQLVQGWIQLVNIALGEPRQCIEAARRGVEALPASYRIRSALMNCLRPRWGGRYEAMQSVATEASRYKQRNAHLRWLDAAVALDRADQAEMDSQFERAERWLQDAFEAGGEQWQLLSQRADLRLSQGRSTEALADLDRALQLAPEHPELLDDRVRTLIALGRNAEATADLQLLTTVDPAAPRVARWRDRILKDLRESCKSLSQQGLSDTAIARCGEVLIVNPQDAEALYWRGRAFLKNGDRERATAAFESALQANPRDRESIRNLDWLYGQRQEWATVVKLWDAYLLLEPGDARALLERAGTKRRLGDMAGACGDLKHACGLGASEACDFARSSCLSPR
jgi:tetratricopeptide (TPR) repeat protein